MTKENENFFTKTEFAKQAGVSRPTLYKWIESGILDEYITDVDGKQMIDKAGLKAVQSRQTENASAKPEVELSQILTRLEKCVNLLSVNENKTNDLQSDVKESVYKIEDLKAEVEQAQEALLKSIKDLDIAKAYEDILSLKDELLQEKDKRIESLEAQLKEKDRQLERKDILLKDRQDQKNPGILKRIFG